MKTKKTEGPQLANGKKPFQIQLSNLNSNPIILYIHIYSLAYAGLADSIEILFYLFCIHVTKSCSICLARDDVIADMYLYRYLVCMGKTTQLLGINFPNKRIPKHLLTKKNLQWNFFYATVKNFQTSNIVEKMA